MSTASWVFVCACCCIGCFLVGSAWCNSMWMKMLIRKGYAEHNATTGAWQWKEKQ